MLNLYLLRLAATLRPLASCPALLGGKGSDCRDGGSSFARIAFSGSSRGANGERVIFKRVPQMGDKRSLLIIGKVERRHNRVILFAAATIYGGMCGRGRLSTDVSEIKLVFGVSPHRPTPNFAASWTVAPTDPLPIVRFDPKAGERSLGIEPDAGGLN